MLDSPPLCTCLGAVAQPLYHNLFCKTFLFYFPKIEFEFTFLVPDSEMSNHSSSVRAFFIFRVFYQYIVIKQKRQEIVGKKKTTAIRKGKRVESATD